jgi:hypothetical protein
MREVSHKHRKYTSEISLPKSARSYSRWLRRRWDKRSLPGDSTIPAWTWLDWPLIAYNRVSRALVRKLHKESAFTAAYRRHVPHGADESEFVCIWARFPIITLENVDQEDMTLRVRGLPQSNTFDLSEKELEVRIYPPL